MNIFHLKVLRNYIKRIINVLFFIVLFFILLLLIKEKKTKGYSLFIEFSNAYGIKQGTNVNFRGVQVGSIKKIYMKVNSIIVLVNIPSSRILIPKKSIVETNQTGLFNDTVIDIIPLMNISKPYFNTNIKNHNINVFSQNCLKSNFLCNYHYLKGNRGLNYDDLVRAATRISQRFDDPRFFSLFYIFLQNSLDISDDFLHICKLTSNFLYFLMDFIEIYLLKFIF
uniref:Hypothetical chloroplast RF22 n=1 Tax=Dasya binghamiae TaxID=1896963 RepID=A0A1C8XSA5_9FLOR|nr:hypothetical chloroplast RF22 [Dasya binghamiae]AOH77380.1 hypothetical chloroplast RF22 [Dasya binghamiae]